MDDKTAKLKSLGTTLPADLHADLALLSGMSEGARRNIWDALGPSLAEPLPDAVERLLDRFCAVHGVAGQVLARSLKGFRFLLREASSRNLSKDDFAGDLEVVFPEDDGARRFLLDGFDRGKAFVRRELATDAILEHGRLLTGVDWRVDTIGASNKARDLGQAVVVLTLTYRENNRTERFTIQALPDALGELQSMLKSVLG